MVYAEVNATYLRMVERDDVEFDALELYELSEPVDARIVIVGPSTAGCCAIDGLSQVDGVMVTLIGRLPARFDLGRDGVAPHHQRVSRLASGWT